MSNPVESYPLSVTGRALMPDGIHIPSSGHAGMGWIILASMTAPVVPRQGKPFVASTNSADLAALAELIDAGTVTPVVERVYPLEQSPEAFRYLDTGHTQAKLVIAVDAGES